MNLEQIDRLMTELYFRPSYKGYQTTLYLIGLTWERIHLMPPPNFGTLCSDTAEHFQIKTEMVTDNLNTMLKSYCGKEDNIRRFETLIGYHIHKRLTGKEFVFVMAKYLSMYA